MKNSNQFKYSLAVLQELKSGSGGSVGMKS